MSNQPYLIAVDTGGTFTDCIALDPSGQMLACKVLSSSSLRGTIVEWLDEQSFYVHHNWHISRDIFQNYTFRFLPQQNGQTQDAETSWTIKKYDAARKIIILHPKRHSLHGSLSGQYFGQKISFEITAHEEAPILATRLITQTALAENFPDLVLRLGTTRGTNALLEMTGAKTAFITTKGFGDILKIGTQQRPDLFALSIQKLEPLYSLGETNAKKNHQAIEIAERIDAHGQVLEPLVLNDLEKIIRTLRRTKTESVAIAFMHSYRNPVHEQALKQALQKHVKYLSLSSELSQQVKFVPRAETTVVNAYLAPILHSYLQNINQKLPSNSLRVMTSAGSLVHTDFFMPKDSLLSGPAGGVVGAAAIGQESGFQRLISFDMGGTSTDVARYDGDFDYRFDISIRHATVFSPALNIETVAAGGGSICGFDGTKLYVGPDSAGASPGPACYGAGGPLTITDVNLLLGRLDAAQFGIPIFKEAAVAKLTDLALFIKEKTGESMPKEVLLKGFLSIANERMAEAIRKISVSKGYAPPQYALLVFGGAGGLHACSLARLLGIQTVLVPAYAGLLSAYGILNAHIERFAEKQILALYEDKAPNHFENTDAPILAFLKNAFSDLEKEAIAKVAAEGFEPSQIRIKKSLIFCRLKGQDAALELDFDSQFAYRFKKQYQEIFGHWVENRPIEIESIRVIALALSPYTVATSADYPMNETSLLQTPAISYRHTIQALVGDTWQEVPVYFRADLRPGASLQGFALLLDAYATTVIEADFCLRIDAFGTAILTQQKTPAPAASWESDANSDSPKTRQAIDLELFTNRFTSLAENMGALLQRTALSVNVKERLDFSCALLDKDGYLIANAPHIPVHLGSLGVCLRSVLKHYPLSVGDTIITNHPAFGGSHLPDVTLISAVYTEGGALIAYIANRCHHAEIGGIRPASMPPDATRLIEEGVIIEPSYLVKSGIVQWAMIREKLEKALYPTRAIHENMADLNAALAANRYGVMALKKMVGEHSLPTVHFYMQALKDYSAQKLKEAIASREGRHFEAEERLDDGTILSVKIHFGDKIVFDFTGTSPVHKGNLNATPAIVHSVVVYVLRLLMTEKIPLNEGLMQNVVLILPDNSILNPHFPINTVQKTPLPTGLLYPQDSFGGREGDGEGGQNSNKLGKDCPAVVGGNVETSQRLTDTLIKALNLLACGQGTMNNVLFGNDTFGYYETICGGTGAGDGFEGCDAIHSHMTNTRITDPEILELRYPVRLNSFSIRPRSGGKGKYRGGRGIRRSLTFLADVRLSVLSQHRLVPPFGLAGGGSAKVGRQYVILKTGKKKKLKGMDGLSLSAGDTFVIETPGGGGFGVV
jgi:5-oxoprolinase (ATP-hydrolysing)